MGFDGIMRRVIRREDLEKRENDTLAPYAAKSAKSLGRKYPEQPHPYRTEFQRDRDRIVHCSAFRRLKHKTQVYVEHEGDLYRTRMTHTMEVAQISRTIARSLALNEDLAEALALAHDLGHPPFGHAGEEELNACMQGHGGFEHNLHSLRLVDVVESRYPEHPGLNLTWVTRESIRKHSIKPKFPVEKEFRPEWKTLLEVQIVDHSDEIAYVSHDVDDSIRAGLCTVDTLMDCELWRDVVAPIRKKKPSLPDVMVGRQAVRTLIEVLVDDLMRHTEKNVKRLKLKTIDSVRNAKEAVAEFSHPVGMKVGELYRFLMTNVYRNYRVVRMAEKGKHFIRQLFEAYTTKPEQLPPYFQRLAKDIGLERTVCDYIAGMTDRFAQDEIRRLFYPYEQLL
jgi:dGTPase